MKNGLQKKDSLMLYGIAILMMIYHHLFSYPPNVEGYFSVLNTYGGELWEQKVAWLMRLCVAFYSFITGYGICRIYSSRAINERCAGKNCLVSYQVVFRQILKLMKKYWLVFFIFIFGGVLIGKKSLIGPITFILSLLGLKSEYNAEWWYVRQYMMMLIMIPILDFFVCNIYRIVKERIIDKYEHGKNAVFLCCLVLGIGLAVFRNASIFSFLIQQLDNGVFVFTLVMVVGYLCAFFHLFEIGSTNMLYQKARPFIAILLLIACIGIRVIRAYSPVYCKYDAFITAPIIYAVCTLLSDVKWITGVLRYIGKYSTYIWLTHTFFSNYYFRDLVFAPKISTLVYIWLILISLITSIGLTWLEKGITRVAVINKRG